MFYVRELRKNTLCVNMYTVIIRLSVVCKSMCVKVHLGQSQGLIMRIHIYFKCKYTYENAGFCILCIDDFKILKIFVKLSKFCTIFYRETSQAPPPPIEIFHDFSPRNVTGANPPPPPTSNVHMTFLVDKIDM